jgi:hypothetical protein
MLDRSEELKFEIVISRKNLSKRLIEKVQKSTTANINKLDDSSTITYIQKVCINYYDILESLKTILELTKRADIVKVNTRELKHGKSIIQEVLCKLEKIEKKIK